jgi:hypothetical protein
MILSRLEHFFANPVNILITWSMPFLKESLNIEITLDGVAAVVSIFYYMISGLAITKSLVEWTYTKWKKARENSDQ